jgi:O-antigen biosynthesis protein
MSMSISEIVERISPQSSVLEVGGASGNIAAALSQSGCSVYCITLDPTAAEAARRRCVEVSTLDLEVQSIATAFPGHTFDYIIFADVLERLREPWAVLATSRTLLKPHGRAIVAIPNIAHGAVRLALLRGDFDYRSLGILESARPRFFTIDTVHELLLRGGFEIVAMDRTRHAVFGASPVLVPAVKREDVDPGLAARIESAAEADTLQFVATARPLTEAERESAIFQRLAAMRGEVASLHRALGIEQPSWQPASEPLSLEVTSLLSRAEQLSLLLNEERERSRALSVQLAQARSRFDQTEKIRTSAREALENEKDRADKLEELCESLRIEMDSVRLALARTEAQLAETRRVLDARDLEAAALGASKLWRLRNTWGRLRSKF